MDVLPVFAEVRIHAASTSYTERMNKSRPIYMQKLIESFPNDPWRGCYYVRDYLAPRVIRTWLHSYVHAFRYRDYTGMRRHAWEALKLVPLLGLKPRRFAYSLALPMMQLPRLGMTLIAAAVLLRRVGGACGEGPGWPSWSLFPFAHMSL